MEKLWFISNPRSGTTSRAKCEALEAVFEEHGLRLVGRTAFPEEDLPRASDLDNARVDTVVLLAGDGTINAALCALARWQGAFLILPGGTMNLLAKALHDQSDPHEIVKAARQVGRRVALPFVEAGQHRAFCALIVGPAAAWFRAREAARQRKARRLLASVRAAWRKTFDRRLRLRGVPSLKRGYQAVLIAPGSPALNVTAIDAPDWRSITELGWSWLTGDWLAGQAVTRVEAEAIGIAGHRPVLALFDGEPVVLDPAITITGGTSREAFIATRPSMDTP